MGFFLKLCCTCTDSVTARMHTYAIHLCTHFIGIVYVSYGNGTSVCGWLFSVWVLNRVEFATEQLEFSFKDDKMITCTST